MRARYAEVATAIEFAIPLADAGDEDRLRGMIGELRGA